MNFSQLNKDDIIAKMRLKVQFSIENFKNGHIPFSIATFQGLFMVTYLLRQLIYNKSKRTDDLDIIRGVAKLLFIIMNSIYGFYRRRIDIEGGSIGWNQRVYFILATISIFYMLNITSNHILLIVDSTHVVYCPIQVYDGVQNLYFLKEVVLALLACALLWLFPPFYTYMLVLVCFIMMECWHCYNFNKGIVKNCRMCNPENTSKAVNVGKSSFISFISPNTRDWWNAY